MMSPKPGGNWESADPSPAVLRAGLILRIVAQGRQRPVRLPDIAAELGIARSSVANVCAALVDIGLLTVTPDGYRIGRGALELAHSYSASIEPIAQFTDYCTRHRDDLHETLHLATLDGFEVVYVARSESHDRVVTSSRVGTRLPANATALGKAMLAQLPSDAVLKLMQQAEPLQALTPRTKITETDILADIENTRAAGYATSDEEVTMGVFGVAVAVHDLPTPEARYAVSGSILKAWSTPARVERLVQEATRVAEAVSGVGRSAE